MITDLSPLLHHVTPAVRTDELQAKKGSWFRFSSLFPDDQKTGWASGKTFVVSQDTLLVDYPVSNNIVNQDWVTLDLTNQTNPTIPGVPHGTAAQQGTLQMYPAQPYIVYQIAVGMKPGKYFCILSIPRGTIPIYQMGSSAIPPGINDPVYRYLGAKYPKDSPVDSPTWFLYSILNAPQIVLQTFMDGGDTMAAGVLYGKCTIIFRVNKCPLRQISIADVASLATPIPANQTVNIQSGRVALVTGAQGTQVTTPQKQTIAVIPGKSFVADTGSTVQTGNGSAVITTMDDVHKWQTVQERALFIPYYTELTGF